MAVSHHLGFLETLFRAVTLRIISRLKWLWVEVDITIGSTVKIILRNPRWRTATILYFQNIFATVLLGTFIRTNRRWI